MLVQKTRHWTLGLWTVSLLILVTLFIEQSLAQQPNNHNNNNNGEAAANGSSSSECRNDGLTIRCMKTGYEADTLTLTNLLKCFDGARCVPYYYSISVYYSRCGYQGKNVKNYTNRFLRPWEAYSYHFAKADPNKCLEYVIHSCSRNSRHSRPVDCSSVFGITRY